MDISTLKRTWNQSPCSKSNRPLWFWVVENVETDLAALGMGRELRRDFIQDLKKKCLKSLDVRGNMLNLHEKHIPRLMEIYKTALDEFIIQE